MNQVLVAQLGARRNYVVPRTLYSSGLLGRLATDLHIAPNKSLELVISFVNRSRLPINRTTVSSLRRTSISEIPPQLITSFPTLGILYRSMVRIANTYTDLDNLYEWAGSAFAQQCSRLALDGIDIVYGFNSASLELFQVARQKNLRCILDQTSAAKSVDHGLMLEEHNLWPHWQPSKSRPHVKENLINRELAEWKTADTILCGSQFVIDTLVACGVQPDKCKLVYSAVDCQKFTPHAKGGSNSRPLRVLFVGSLAVRKGIGYFWRAIKELNSPKIEARAVGPSALYHNITNRIAADMDIVGSCSYQELQRHYAWADVFVLPSICEGSALVTYEALASGLPVITTPNAGSVIRHGVDGYIVPIRQSTDIALALEQLTCNRALLKNMSQEARSRALEFTEQAYQQRLVSSVING